MKSQSIYKLNLTLGLLKFWQTLAGKSCSVLWYIKGKLRGFSNICWKIWKDGTLFNCTQKSIKNSTHSIPLDYCEAHSCPRSELWTIKLLVFKATKVPKPHINQTNNMLHRGRPKNLTPVGPLWCAMGGGAQWLLWSWYINQWAFKTNKVPKSHIKQTILQYVIMELCTAKMN